METPVEQPSPTKVKTELVDEESTIPFILRNDIVNHIKTETPSDDEDQKPDSDCPPLKKRKPENVQHDQSKEPDQTHQSKENDFISGCDDNSSVTENKFNPNGDHLLASGTLGSDKGNDEIKHENSECIKECSPVTIKGENQIAVENHTILPDMCHSEDKMVQIKSEPESTEKISHIQKTKVNGKRKAEKNKWFRCKSEGCPYKTRYYVVFIRHQLRHKYRSRLKCRYCSFSCKRRGMLTSHLLEHIDAQNKDSAPPEADNLKELNWLNCLVENCSFKTKNCVHLENHVTYHQRQQLLKCRYCSMPCRGRVRMKAHLLRHHSRENDKGKPFAEETPQVHSSDSDSESEVDIRAMILKEEISGVNRQKDIQTKDLHEENSQRASQDYKDKLSSCDDNDETRILRIGDPREELNEKEAEVSRTITITIRHSKKSDDNSSLKTALVSGILKSFGMSDEQTNPCQTQLAEDEDNRESQDSVGTGEIKKPPVVADILRLFDVSNEEESGSSSVSRQKNTDDQETEEESGKTDSLSAPNGNAHTPESFKEITDLAVNATQLLPTLNDNQSENDAVDTPVTAGQPEELANNNKCELQQSSTTIPYKDQSDKKKIANLKQVVISRVRKTLVENSSIAEDMRTSDSSRIPKPLGSLNEEIRYCVHSQCPYKTANARDMKLHLSFHGDIGILKCPNCTYGCQNVSDLKEHMNLHIEKCNSMRNNVEISPLTSPLRKPSEEDTGQVLEPLIICNPVFTCKFCPTKLNHEKLFKQHLIRHCSTAGIKCPLCTYKSSKTDLLKHLSCHVENIDGMFLCPLCIEKKRNKESIDDHVKVIHSRALFQEHNATCSKTYCNGHC